MILLHLYLVKAVHESTFRESTFVRAQNSPEQEEIKTLRD